jgi:cytochrome c556
MTKTTRTGLFLALLSAVALGQQQSAGPSPADAIKARQGLMQLQKFSLAAVNNAVKDGGNVTEAAVQAAQNLQYTGDMMTMAFSLAKDTGADKYKGQTRAKPELWKNEAELKEMVVSFQRDTQKLASAAKSKDATAVRDQLKTVGADCNSCHKKFRAEQ